MTQPAHVPFISPEAYLAWEAEQTERHEYINGEVFDVFAMAGAQDKHITVSMNLAFALRQHLRGSPCRTYMSDMRLQVEASNCYFYPDVLVTCSAKDASSASVKSEPKLLAEVLSPITAAYDRGLKFAHYRNLPSLEEYILIDIDTRTIDGYRKGGDGLWVLHPFARGESVSLASVGLELTADELFSEVDD